MKELYTFIKASTIPIFSSAATIFISRLYTFPMSQCDGMLYLHSPTLSKFPSCIPASSIKSSLTRQCYHNGRHLRGHRFYQFSAFQAYLQRLPVYSLFSVQCNRSGCMCKINRYLFCFPVLLLSLPLPLSIQSTVA